MQIDLTSEETGEVFDSFEVDDEEFARWEKAAEISGLSIEDFLREAIVHALDKYRDQGVVVD